MKSAVHVMIHGRVQGVGLRYFARQQAEALGLTGWVRNLPEGHVEAYAEGSREALEQWIIALRQGPPFSRIQTLETQWQNAEGLFTTFSIR